LHVRLLARVLSPVAITAGAIGAIALVLEVREPHFSLGLAALMGYAAAVELPCAWWAQSVSRDLRFGLAGRLTLLSVAWVIPVALYAVVAGPTWMVIGAADGDVTFVIKGACLSLVTLALVIAAFVHRRWRTAARAG
jgi:hypothetical protein